MNFEEIEKIVKLKLSEERFYHSKCVAKRCKELAIRYKIDEEKAVLVGITHDMAKEMPDDEKLKYAHENSLCVDEIERLYPGLIHGKIAADMTKKQFGFTEEMAQAIECHTTGKENMNILDKILYVADSSGEDRKWDDIDYVKQIADENIDNAVLYLLNCEIKDRIKNNKVIHVNSVYARNYLLFNKK